MRLPTTITKQVKNYTNYRNADEVKVWLITQKPVYNKMLTGISTIKPYIPKAAELWLQS